MTESDLIKGLAASAGTVPAQADVFGVRRFSLEDLQRRTKQFLASIAEVSNVSLDKGDWSEKRERIAVTLPRGARAVVYRASGAMKFVAGLAPMEHLFPAATTKDALTKATDTAFARLKLAGWAS